MRLFTKTKPAAPVVQMRETGAHPFGILQNAASLGGGSIAVYRAIRANIPIVDAAVGKIIRLCGGFRAECKNKTAAQELNRFLRTANTGRGQRGLQAFLDCYLDSMLTCGSAVGEIVTAGTTDIAAVVCGDIRDVHIREGGSPLEFEICGEKNGVLAPFPHQELLLFTPFCPEADNPYGVSLLRSMPYLAGTLMGIYESMNSNFERSGNLRYAVTYKPGGDILDRANAAERLNQIATEWSNAMQSCKSGLIKDFVALGDVDIKTIGADSEMPDTETPVRQILEQLISKTGIPPFMLGLSWSSTERMSAQQADVMTSEITAIRRSLNPVLERICTLWMEMHGYPDDYEIVWDDINLQDEVEEARARLYAAQADELRQEMEEKL